MSLNLKCKLHFWLVATLNILSAFLVDLLGGGKDDIWIGERGRGLGGGPVVCWWSGRRLGHELQHCTLTPVQRSLHQPHFYQCHFNVWLKFLGSTVLKKITVQTRSSNTNVHNGGPEPNHAGIETLLPTRRLVLGHHFPNRNLTYNKIALFTVFNEKE